MNIDLSKKALKLTNIILTLEEWENDLLHAKSRDLNLVRRGIVGDYRPNNMTEIIEYLQELRDEMIKYVAVSAPGHRVIRFKGKRSDLQSSANGEEVVVELTQEQINETAKRVAEYVVNAIRTGRTEGFEMFTEDMWDRCEREGWPK